MLLRFIINKMISRKTKQKLILEEEINKMNNFFSAEELFAKVKNKKIGIATVYRFLHDLRKQRKLHSYTCNKKIVYSKNSNNHSHFICQKCGKTIHFNLDNIDFINKKIHGEICHFQVEVSGICKDCK